MDLSGIIFVVLALAWAVYLIPKAVKHHDEVARTRSVDRFSTAMRVLARREPIDRRNARLVVTPPRSTDRVLLPSRPDAATDGPTASPQVPRRSVAARRAAARAAARRRRPVTFTLRLMDLVVGHHYNSTVEDGATVSIRLYLNRGTGDGGAPRFEDVTTAGTSIRESLPLISLPGIKPVGLVVSVDRMERGRGSARLPLDRPRDEGHVARAIRIDPQMNARFLAELVEPEGEPQAACASVLGLPSTGWQGFPPAAPWCSVSTAAASTMPAQSPNSSPRTWPCVAGGGS